MNRRHTTFTVFVFVVVILLMVYYTSFNLSNSTSARMTGSSIYGTGCPENLFHKRLEILFRTWKTIAAQRNITYFVCYGALLGLIRDGDVVPYDNDLDVCIFRKELYKLELEDEPKPFKPDDGKTHLIYQKHCHHPPLDTSRTTCKGEVVATSVDQCTFLDPCARIVLRPPTSSRTTWLDVFALRDNGSVLLDDYKRVIHKRSVILPLKQCVFMGMQTICPNNITSYLTRYYGKDFATNSHYVCQNGEWVATGDNVKHIALPRCPQRALHCHVKVFINKIQNWITSLLT